MKNIVIIGGGVIGLSSALYLRQAGHEVTVLDKNDFTDNCSYGNAGYVCPSHFIPLAAPGIVTQGLKWMFNPLSPFYVKPSLSSALLGWGMRFVRSATKKNVAQAGVPLRDIALLSTREYAQWEQLPGFSFDYERKGMLEIFQTEQNAEHAHHTVAQAKALGLDTELVNREELQALEPYAKVNALGAIYFKCDGHLWPNKLMEQLKTYLRTQGVTLRAHQEVKNIAAQHGRITKVITQDGEYSADEVVLAAGAWSRELAQVCGAGIPLMPGRGYSVTLDDFPVKVNHPAVLVEGRAAITPLGASSLRLGGTMEVVPTHTPPNYKRVQGIVNTVNDFFPDFNIALPSEDKMWYGYRPCSADGIPYIGRGGKYGNLVIATGHSMLGLSLGAATGRLVSEVIDNRPAAIDLKPFDPDRFQ